MDWECASYPEELEEVSEDASQSWMDGYKKNHNTIIYFFFFKVVLMVKGATTNNLITEWNQKKSRTFI